MTEDNKIVDVNGDPVDGTAAATTPSPNVSVPPVEGISSMPQDNGEASYGNDGPGPGAPMVSDKAPGAVDGSVDHLLTEKVGQSKFVKDLGDVAVNNEHPTSVAHGFVDPYSTDAAALKWLVDVGRYIVMRAEEHLNKKSSPL